VISFQCIAVGEPGFQITCCETLYYGGGEVLEQVAQRSCGCPIPGSVQGQAGWSFEQPSLVEAVPANGRGLEVDDL